MYYFAQGLGIWSSFGQHLDIIWTSLGHHLDQYLGEISNTTLRNWKQFHKSVNAKSFWERLETNQLISINFQKRLVVCPVALIRFPVVHASTAETHCDAYHEWIVPSVINVRRLLIPPPPISFIFPNNAKVIEVFLSPCKFQDTVSAKLYLEMMCSALISFSQQACDRKSIFTRIWFKRESLLWWKCIFARV